MMKILATPEEVYIEVRLLYLKIQLYEKVLDQKLKNLGEDRMIQYMERTTILDNVLDKVENDKQHLRISVYKQWMFIKSDIDKELVNMFKNDKDDL